MVLGGVICCITSRKVTGSIPVEVIDIFYLPNPSYRIMALESTQPLKGIFSGGKGGRCVALTTLPLSCADNLETLGA